MTLNSFALWLGLLFLSIGHAQVVEVTGRAVNVRSSTNWQNSNSWLGQLNAGDTLEIDHSEPRPGRGWYKVKYNGQTAYISANYTRINNSVSQRAPAQAAQKYVEVSGNGIAIRTAPVYRGRAGRQSYITALKKGELLEIDDSPGRVPRGWRKVKYNGETAYIVSKFSTISERSPETIAVSDPAVSQVEASTASIEGASVPEKKYIEIKGNRVGVRNAANTRNNSLLTRLNDGELLEVDDSDPPAPRGWRKVKYKGETAYVAANYSGQTNRTPEVLAAAEGSAVSGVGSEATESLDQAKAEAMQKAPAQTPAVKEEEKAEAVRETNQKDDQEPDPAQREAPQETARTETDNSDQVRTEAGLQNAPNTDCENCRNQNFEDLEKLLNTNRGLVQFPVKENYIGFCGSFHYIPTIQKGELVDNYATPAMACSLMALMQKWKQDECPDSQKGCRIQFGDMSHKTKLKFEPHSIGGHGYGNCVDIRPFRKGGFHNSAQYYTGGGYDQATTAKFVKMAKEMGADTILFNDPAFRVQTGKNKKGKKYTIMPKAFGGKDLGVSYSGGHANHLHVCFTSGPKTKKTCENFKYDEKTCGPPISTKKEKK